jgi:ribosome maturation factor RimP
MKRVGLSDPVLEEFWGVAQKAIEALPYEILNLEWSRLGPQKVLRVYILRKDGQTVSIGDCTRVNQALDVALETQDPISFGYTLEVSSPGVNRPLVWLKDFQEFEGKMVRIESIRPINGRRRFHGRLGRLNLKESEPQLTVTIDHQTYDIPFLAIKKAHLDFFEGV